MRTPYLIQRAKFKKKEGRGIDTLLRFDYMGSSEFENGALSKSLTRIREIQSEFIQFEFIFENFEDNPLVVLCKEVDKDRLPEILKQLAYKETRLKEYCDLGDYLKGNKNYKTSDFWWDIENDFFFWVSNSEFNVSFMKSLFNDN